MKLEVLTAHWAADDNVFEGGVHEDVKLTRKLAPLVAGAEAAGVIVVTASREERKLLGGHVESQADGEKAYERAQKTGRWHHGNLSQFVAGAQDRLAYDDTLEAGADDKLTDDERATLEAQLEQARVALAGSEVPE